MSPAVLLMFEYCPGDSLIRLGWIYLPSILVSSGPKAFKSIFKHFFWIPHWRPAKALVTLESIGPLDILNLSRGTVSEESLKENIAAIQTIILY